MRVLVCTRVYWRISPNISPCVLPPLAAYRQSRAYRSNRYALCSKVGVAPGASRLRKNLCRGCATIMQPHGGKAFFSALRATLTRRPAHITANPSPFYGVRFVTMRLFLASQISQCPFLLGRFMRDSPSLFTVSDLSGWRGAHALFLRLPILPNRHGDARPIAAPGKPARFSR